MNPLDKVPTNSLASSLKRFFFPTRPRSSGLDTESGLSGVDVTDPSFLQFKQFLQVDGTRKALYKDFQAFDEDPFGSGALDIFASLIVQGEIEEDETSALEVQTSSSEQKEIFDRMELRTNLKERLYSMVRGSCKFGINPQEIVYSPNVGISKLNPIHPSSFAFVNEQDPYNEKEEFPYVQMNGQSTVIAKFRRFQIFLNRVGSDDYRIYGRSVLHSVRKTLKILGSLEDSVAFREFNRSSQRYQWKIDCTGLDKDAAQAYCRRMMKIYSTKVRGVDANGNLNLERLPLANQGDIALPVFKDGAPDIGIEALPQDNSASSIAVIQHFMGKFFGGVRIPSYYFSYEGSKQPRNASSLTYNDILLAKLIYRYQSGLISQLWEVYDYESRFHGIDEDFKIKLPLISTVDDLRRYQVLNLKLTIAQMLKANLKMVDDLWVYDFLKFKAPDIERLNTFREMVQEDERMMMELASRGVFVQQISTFGNFGINQNPSPYDIPPPQEPPPGTPVAPPQETIDQAFNRRLSLEERQVIQAKLRSEELFQSLLRDKKVASQVQDILDLGKMRAETPE